MIDVENLDLYKSKNIVDLETAVSLIKEFKSEGKKVGLCHGGFDLTHPGHVKHFECAKELCDLLFVSITSDKYVVSRKGTGRPIYTDQLRAYMTANIKPVDYVVVTDFEKGTEVINLLKPSFYIKGPDFISKNTPGITAEREAIKKAGGEMKYTTEPPMSTTKIIKYIKKEINYKNLLLVIDRDGTLIKNNDFPGKSNNWLQELVLNKDVVSLISHLQTKYNTTKIVVSNQAGVARRFFDCKRVEKINKHVDSELNKLGVKINSWQYCPYVDSTYASSYPELNVDPKYIADKTKRKPNIDMVVDGLLEINAKFQEFDHVIVFGDRSEDFLLAKKLKAHFIDVNEKDYKTLIHEVENI